MAITQWKCKILKMSFMNGKTTLYGLWKLTLFGPFSKSWLNFIWKAGKNSLWLKGVTCITY